MAEDIPATPGWVEGRLDEIWASSGIADTAGVSSARNAYLSCLATCGTGSDDPERCHDLCRQAFIESLRSSRVSGVARAALEAQLEKLEAEISEDTSPGPSK